MFLTAIYPPPPVSAALGRTVSYHDSTELLLRVGRPAADVLALTFCRMMKYSHETGLSYVPDLTYDQFLVTLTLISYTFTLQVSV